MTREQQIEQAAKEYKWRAANGTRPDWDDVRYYGFIHGAKWALQQSPWISVDDELPPLLKKVYVYSIVYSRFGEWQTQRFIEPDGKEHTDIEEHGFYTGSAPYYSPHMQITHWRPMSLFPDKY